MIRNSLCWGYAPPEAVWSKDNTDDGYYSFSQYFFRALACRDHLGYDHQSTPWKKH